MTRALIVSLVATTALVPLARAQAPAEPPACERLVQAVEARRAEPLPVTPEAARTLRDARDEAGCRDAIARIGQAATPAPAGPDGTPLRVDPSRIVVQQPAPTVQVQPAPPQVVVQQARPEVTVRQPRPEIIVRQAAPTVTVDIPQPEIIVRMPPPEVNVATAPPQVEVRQPQPQVQIVQPPAPPRVDVAPVLGEAQVQVRRPDAPADVRLEGAPAQAEVRYERAEPRVVVNQPQGQPNIRFEPADAAAPAAPAPLAQAPAPAPPPPVPAPPAPETAPRTAESVPPVPLAPIGPGATTPAPALQAAQAPYGTADGTAPAATGAVPAPGPQQVAVSRLKDLKLHTVQGQTLGEVERVVQGTDGAIALVVAHGGFLGLGERHVLVPAAQVSLRDDRLVAQALTDDQLRALPTLDRDAPGWREVEDARQVPVGPAP